MAVALLFNYSTWQKAAFCVFALKDINDTIERMKAGVLSHFELRS